MAEERVASRGDDDDDFLLEEHSGESGGDESAVGLELDDFQAKEIRHIFLTTLPDYLVPVSQMLDQVLSVSAGREEVRRALHTTLSSISAAASRVGIDDVNQAVEMLQDQLLALDDEPTPPPAKFQKTVRDAFAALEAIAGVGEKRADGPAKETILAALRQIDDLDKSVLERLTAAGLVTVDQLRMADVGEVVAVTGLKAQVVERLFDLLVRAPDRSAEKAQPKVRSAPAAAVGSDPKPEVAAVLSEPQRANEDAISELPSQASSVPKQLREKLRAQVDVEASIDQLRADILRTKLRIAACKQRVAAAERRRDRVRRELGALQKDLARGLGCVTAARLEQAKLERESADRENALEDGMRRIAKLRREHRAVLAERDKLAQAISGLVERMTRVKDALRVPEHEPSSGKPSPEQLPPR